MTNTNDLIDKFIIFFACVCIYLVQSVLAINVVPIIITIIISCLLSYLDKEKLKIILYLTVFILCLMLPSLILFLPLFIYDLFYQRYQVVILVLAIPWIVTWEKSGLMLFGTTLVLAILGLWIKNRTMNLYKLKERYHEVADGAREMSDRLKSQNKDLAEKMDNDINLATLKERNRIAREIHDHVGHQLSSAILQIGALLVINKDEKFKEPLLMANNTLSQAMTSIRASVHDLHDQSVDLHMQIETILSQFSYCEVIFEDQLMTQPDKKLKLAFIAITKEALSNIIKHSDATVVHILLREHPAFYQLIIKDNGIVKTFSQDNGMGLINMADRVQAFNGNINFINEKGFEIFISIPKGEHN